MIIGILLFIITKINLHTVLIRRFVHPIKVTEIKSEKEAKQASSFNSMFWNSYWMRNLKFKDENKFK